VPDVVVVVVRVVDVVVMVGRTSEELEVDELEVMY